tara:strand:- start:132 stop:494 length:363 start_codon:yes stop_codon:yes gene_type:complete
MINVEENLDSNTKEKYSAIYLEKVRKNIESMDKIHHIIIANILKENNIKLDENSNGIFVNLTYIDNYIIDKIEEYLNYVNIQEKDLKKDEKLKENLENKYFKDNKDNNNNKYNVEICSDK